MPGVEGLVSEMETRVEDGRIALARDSKRIAESVQMLGGTLRQKMLAETRLVAAGEYAMPALLAAVVATLADSGAPARAAASEMLVASSKTFPHDA